MIGKDRIALNERFKTVYHLLEEKGIIVKNHPNKSKSAFAEILLGSKQYGHIITKFLNGSRPIDYKHARTLCREYGVSEEYMFDGVGTPFDTEKELPKLQIYNNDEDYGTQGNILFTTVEAFAGSSVAADSFSPEENSFFSIPDLEGDDLVAFNINGNSMEPILESGDLVICRELSSVDNIRDNEIYAVKNNGSLWVKYVQKVKDSRGNVVQLKLISENKLEHDPFYEEVDRHTRLYKIIRRISSL